MTIHAPNGQPVLDAAVVRLAEEILSSVVEGGFCCVQPWDNRIDCCLKLSDGKVIGEMVRLAELSGRVLREVGERLRCREMDPGAPLLNELRPPVRILATWEDRTLGEPRQDPPD